ncbi:hypothetical protein ACHAQJ_003170 [Trichoderma viride]
MLTSRELDSISACVHRINDQLLAYNTAKSEHQLLRLQNLESRGLAKKSLEAQLRLKTQEKIEKARVGLHSQIELLQLLKGSTLDEIPYDVQKALTISFPGDSFAELREQFELERDIAISPGGQLTTFTPDDGTPALAAFDREATIVDTLDANMLLGLDVYALKFDSCAKVAFSDADTEEAEYSPDDDELEEISDDDWVKFDGEEAKEVKVSTDSYGKKKNTITIPFVDEIGLTRIGPQPRSPAIQIK